MIKRIKAGRHRATPPSFAIWWNKRVIQQFIKFDQSCRYMSDAEDDINKLFGIGYANGGHHVDSARFGWRYSSVRNQIQIVSYCYISGEREYAHICYVDFDREYPYTILVRSTEYQFICDAYTVAVQHRHRKKLGYALGLFFGGNKPAPHEMKIEVK